MVPGRGFRSRNVREGEKLLLKTSGLQPGPAGEILCTIHGYQTRYHPRNPDGSRVEESVSVDVEEVKLRDWAENAYQPDVVNNSEKLYKKPGYTM